MARWDRNWQGAAHGSSGLRLQRDPRRGGPIQGGKAVLSGGKSAPLSRTAGRDPLTSRSVGGYLSTGGRVGASTGRLVNTPAGGDRGRLTAEATTPRPTTPQERAGRNPFSPGPLQPTGERVGRTCPRRSTSGSCGSGPRHSLARLIGPAGRSITTSSASNSTSRTNRTSTTPPGSAQW
jgi:hypothetical protein